VTAIETDRGEQLSVAADGLRLTRPGRKEKTLPREDLGDQQIVVGAPLVLLDREGSVTAILGDVTTVVTR
jgi:hypothetical protein